MPKHGRGWRIVALLVAVGLIAYSLAPNRRHPVPPEELARLAAEMEQRFQVDRSLILAVVENESGGDAWVVSEAGAVGLMQLLPATARGVADKNKLTCDLRDPASNMAMGTAYLRELGDKFGDQPDLVIAAYHAGPNRVQGWRKANPALSITDMLAQSAGPRTRAYVSNVKASWQKYRARNDLTLAR